GTGGGPGRGDRGDRRPRRAGRGRRRQPPLQPRRLPRARRDVLRSGSLPRLVGRRAGEGRAARLRPPAEYAPPHIEGGEMGGEIRFALPASELPRAWYNLNADMPVPMAPPLHPQTKEPVTPEFLSVLSPMALLAQDVSGDDFIGIPEPVRD